ncbi:hypothetical protein CLOHAE12215_02038 [Clostridium haemolyticum]|uniref:hypothetical protein n=1 Tax=Clostridium haemolyticum TaxID=84025 RepID=UPI001C39D996|nr:hypothetical protein [Clostridium haemolyticum]CAG7840614.1 hypothetical protein CLOHAE12215_02038 [Clostridium haemolyticum]
MLKNGIKIILKNRISFFLILLSTVVLPFVDIKHFGLIGSYEPYIFRSVNQYFFISIMLPFIVGSIYSQKTVSIIDNHLTVYCKDKRGLVHSLLKGSCIIMSFMFLVGILFRSILNYFVNSINFLRVDILHIILGEILILSIIYFMFYLRIKFTKSIIAYSVYFGILLIMLAINNFYITIPITIKIAENPKFLFHNPANVFVLIPRILILIGLIFLYFKNLKRKR